MAKDPAFLFYYQDFIFGTGFMEDKYIGQYIKILCHLADKGRLSEEQVLSICKASAIHKSIQDKLEVDNDGYYFNERLRGEVDKRKKFTESRRKNAASAKHMHKHMEDENENEDVNVIVIKDKKEYAEFVKMTEKEYNKLREAYGLEFTTQCITQLDNYKGSSGKKYKSDYRAILSWVVDRIKRGKPDERFTRGAIDANAVAAEIKKYSKLPPG